MQRTGKQARSRVESTDHNVAFLPYLDGTETSSKRGFDVQGTSGRGRGDLEKTEAVFDVVDRGRAEEASFDPKFDSSAERSCGISDFKVASANIRGKGDSVEGVRGGGDGRDVKDSVSRSHKARVDGDVVSEGWNGDGVAETVDNRVLFRVQLPSGTLGIGQTGPGDRQDGDAVFRGDGGGRANEGGDRAVPDVGAALVVTEDGTTDFAGDLTDDGARREDSHEVNSFEC